MTSDPTREALERIIRLAEAIPHSVDVEQAGMQAEVVIETARSALSTTPAPLDVEPASIRLIRMKVKHERAALDKWIAEHRGVDYEEWALTQREQLLAEIDRLRGLLGLSAPPPLAEPCARYFGSDGTLCATHNGRFLSDTTMRCDRSTP